MDKNFVLEIGAVAGSVIGAVTGTVNFFNLKRLKKDMKSAISSQNAIMNVITEISNKADSEIMGDDDDVEIIAE